MSIVTVIPAYKSQYIEDVLSSLEKQTVQPDRIIFSDDSKDNSVVKKIEHLLNKKSPEFQSKIILKEGPKKGGMQILQVCLIYMWTVPTNTFTYF
jgi:glycosyltransferase involved in cell wall biosynthesis